MKKMLMLFALFAFAGAASGGASECGCVHMDNTQARGYFKSFMHRFDDLNLTANESRAELKWFIDQGDNGRDYARDAFHDRNLPARERLAALYIFCKGWPATCEERLAEAERSKLTGFTAFGRRLREYLGSEVSQIHAVR